MIKIVLHLSLKYYIGIGLYNTVMIQYPVRAADRSVGNDVIAQYTDRPV